MALTRAQLLAGDVTTGAPVLSGQVQGVRQGTGVLILSDGTINFDASTAVGAMRLNNSTAYNAYSWPSLGGPPAVNTILYSDGTGSVNWTANYVPTTGATGAGNLPVGVIAQRPATPIAGQIRYNSETIALEYYNGSSWISVVGGGGGGGGGGGSFIVKTVPTAPATATANAVIPAGSTADRQTAPAVVAGEFRYNTTNSAMEYYDGANWVSLASVSATTTFGLGLDVTGQLVKAAVPEAAAPPAAGALPTQAVIGSTYYDTNLGAMFMYYSNGGTPTWVMV